MAPAGESMSADTLHQLALIEMKLQLVKLTGAGNDLVGSNNLNCPGLFCHSCPRSAILVYASPARMM
jgi:hypothetical protein